MTRLDEVEAEIADLDDSYSARTYTDSYADLARTLAAEVDARDAVITELLAMLEPDDHESKCNCDECRLRRETYARAVAIAESCTETTTTKKDHEQ